MLCLAPTFSGAAPDQFPRDEISVLVLIAPRAVGRIDPDLESRPDLLAPRNVLTRQAANRASSPAPYSFPAMPWDDESRRADPHVQPAHFEILTDEPLLESPAELGDEEIFVTPDDDLLEEPLPEATQARARRFFVVKLPKRLVRIRTRAIPAEGVFFGGVFVGR
jgi:hypothetical protein